MGNQTLDDINEMKRIVSEEKGVEGPAGFLVPPPQDYIDEMEKEFNYETRIRRKYFDHRISKG